MVINGKKMELTGKPKDEEGSATADQDHAVQNHSQSNIAAAIISFTNEYRARDGQNQREQQKTNCWVKAGTIFVAFYTAITFFQSCVTWKALTHTVAMSRLDQRAWVGVINPTIPQFKVGEKMNFGALITNSGKTPARKVTPQVTAQLVLKGHSVHIAYEKSETPQSTTILSPGMRMTITNPDPDTVKDFTEGIVKAIQNREVTTYLFGKIYYEDIF